MNYGLFYLFTSFFLALSICWTIAGVYVKAAVSLAGAATLIYTLIKLRKGNR